MFVEVLQGLFSLGFGLISFVFRILVAGMIGLTMTAKGRNGMLWGLAGFVLPWLIFFVWFVPDKEAKLNSAIRNHPAFAGKNPVVAAIMALSAMVAKSDGHVSKEEVQLIRNFIQRQFRMDAATLNGYEGAFNYGKEHPEDYEYFTELLRQYRRYNIVTAVSYLFVGMSIQQNGPEDVQDLTLRRILTGLGLHEYEYQSIRNHYTRSQQGYGGHSYHQGGYDRRYQQAGPSTADLRKKYSDILGVAETADMPTIKKAYRKLAKEYHPDKMAQDGMPEGYMAYATEKIAEINEAYEWLKNTKTATI